MEIRFLGQVVEARMVVDMHGGGYVSFTPCDGRPRFIHVDNPCVKIPDEGNVHHGEAIAEYNKRLADSWQVQANDLITHRLYYLAGACERIMDSYR